MRGTLEDGRRQPADRGIIPAHAGNTAALRSRSVDYRDHPRACGEHCDTLDHATRNRGSSPRMRGTLDVGLPSAGWTGIIPAHAGNTKGSSIAWRPSGDHPRACGEHQLWILLMTPGLGSSPRMRGTPWCGVRPQRQHGIIPAHAGNTKSIPCDQHESWDHPRACGEHIMQSGSKRSQPGSSPRMRGTPGLDPDYASPFGIIPAHAGNTWSTDAPHEMYRDHPRACGEHH